MIKSDFVLNLDQTQPDPYSSDQQLGFTIGFFFLSAGVPNMYQRLFFWFTSDAAPEKSWPHTCTQNYEIELPQSQQLTFWTFKILRIQYYIETQKSHMT